MCFSVAGGMQTTTQQTSNRPVNRSKFVICQLGKPGWRKWRAWWAALPDS